MLTLSDIQAARTRIHDSIVVTPCKHSATLSALVGGEVFLKLENLQQTGSFKDRGALNKMRLLDETQRAAGVIAASAGNHAQAVAHTAQMLGIRATIVMPETAPLTKVRGTQAFGAEIVLHGSSYADAFEKASTLRDQHGYTFIHAFDDPQIIAGQGTIALELLEQLPNLDVLIAPIGGGGLISGIAVGLKEIRPEVRCVGVQAARLASMQESLLAGKIVSLRSCNTIADGISIATVGQHTFPLVSRHVADIFTVTEDEIACAIMALLETEKTLAEGAGAVGVAALYAGRITNLRGKKIVVIVSGGNIDMSLLSVVLDRSLEAAGRLVHLRVVVPDKPGSIAILAQAVAAHRANILHIHQDRHASEVALGEIEVGLSVETKGQEHAELLYATIRQTGFKIKP